MSVRAGKTMSLAGISGVDYANKTTGELNELFHKVLNDGMHGICFSAYEEGQKPGDSLTEEQIRKRMRIIALILNGFVLFRASKAMN